MSATGVGKHGTQQLASLSHTSLFPNDGATHSVSERSARQGTESDDALPSNFPMPHQDLSLKD